MLIWLASYPRSGNSFLRRLLRRLYGCPSWSIYPSDRASVFAADYTGPPLEQMPLDEHPYFVKTHDLPFGDDHPAIYLVRDGRDSLVSYSHFTLHPREEHEPPPVTPEERRTTLYNLMTNRRTPFGLWSQNVNAWTRRPQTILLRFEELIQGPEHCLRRVVGQLGLPLQEKPGATSPTFEELHQQKPRLFRKGKIGSWREEFPPDLLDEFWKLHGETMIKFGYEKHELADLDQAKVA